MKLFRRQFLQLAAGAVALPVVPHEAWAQSYPVRPVRLVAQVPAGSSPDIIARVMADWLWKRTGQPFVLDNRPGASGNIGTNSVITSDADGYSLLFSMSANAINVSLYNKLRWNFAVDTAPVAMIGRTAMALVINPSVPAKTVPEFIAYAKANPDTINLASVGIGTLQAVATELFKMMAGVSFVNVPFRGEQSAVTDLISGQVQVMFGLLPSVLPYVRSNQVRVLAVTTTQRQEVLPDVPTMAEFLPGYEASGWYGISAPKNTPTEIIERLNKEVNAGLADPKTRQHLADLGCQVFDESSPADFAKFTAGEIEKWGKVIRTAGMKAE